MKLRSKIYLYSSVLFAVLLIAVNISVYILFDRMSVNDEMKRTETAAESIVKGVQRFAGSIPPDDLLRAYAPLDGMLRIVRPNGTSTSPVITSKEHELNELKYEYEEGRRVDRIHLGGSSYVFVSIPVIWPDGVVVNVQVIESMAETENRLSVLRTVLIMVTLIALVPAILSSRILGNRMMDPITSMIRTMKDILRSGEFKRLKQGEQSKDELAEMGDTFNQMIDMLESSFERQERFVSDASHELKTPLTIIESYASLLNRRGRDHPELFDESVEAILSESIRMREMTEQLLMLAKKPEQWNLTFEKVNISHTVTETVRAFQNAYHRDIVFNSKDPIWQKTDESKLKQLLFILLDNARKYSEDIIEVQIMDDRGLLAIRIIDHGIGIPSDELDKVFDRFYRIDPARTRQSGEGGSGLGLSLAADIARAIGVRIELDSQVGQGTTASIIFMEMTELIDTTVK